MARNGGAANSEGVVKFRNDSVPQRNCVGLNRRVAEKRRAEQCVMGTETCYEVKRWKGGI